MRAVLNRLLVQILVVFLCSTFFDNPTPPPTIPDMSKSTPSPLPEHRIQNFKYQSIQDNKKQWELESVHALVLKTKNIIQAYQIKAYFYDETRQKTTITGKTALYFLDSKILEISDQVITTFPDQSQVHSPFLSYSHTQQTFSIPTQNQVKGFSQLSTQPLMRFQSYGLLYDLKTAQINLLSQTRVTLQTPTEMTVIRSDRCEINRKKNQIHFTMAQPFQGNPFVHITQPNLFAQARSVDLYYSDEKPYLHSWTGSKNVFIKEILPEGSRKKLRYSTAEHAAFDAKKNCIELTELPQVYQDHDTVTGDKITINRDSNTIEVHHSNGYTEGRS